MLRLAKNCSPRLHIFNQLLCTSNKDRMQNFHPREFEVSTRHLRANNPFGASSPRVSFLDI
jgi:hypothetical protein